jgi:hypothetical protein
MDRDADRAREMDLDTVRDSNRDRNKDNLNVEKLYKKCTNQESRHWTNVIACL